MDSQCRTGARRAKNCGGWLLPLPPPRNRLSLAKPAEPASLGSSFPNPAPRPMLGPQLGACSLSLGRVGTVDTVGAGGMDPPNLLESLDRSRPLGTWWGEQSQTLGLREGHTPQGGARLPPSGAVCSVAGSISAPPPLHKSHLAGAPPSTEEPEQRLCGDTCLLSSRAGGRDGAVQSGRSWLHGELLQREETERAGWGGSQQGQQQEAKGAQPLTMMALTMSLWLSLRARTALALDTLACAITSSMSRSSSPASSTWSGASRQVLGQPPPQEKP